jgi:trk system potassium uptake protein TrkH
VVINLRAITFINGIAVCGLAVAMLIPLIFDISISTGKCVGVFTPLILACTFLGGLAILSCKSSEEIVLTRKDAFLLVVSLWCVTVVTCSFPFYIYSGVKLPFMSALFEAASGITTTGATIYHDIEALPRALVLWRFILHFIGGVGIVAIGIIAFPLMRVGGMQLFLTENSDKSKKFFPRVSQMVGAFVGIYTGVIIAFAIMLKMCGMNHFDAICHSVSAISTGGFSTKNGGIGWFGSGVIELIMASAMFVGGLTFFEIVKCFKTGLRGFWGVQQTRGYIKIVALMIAVPIIVRIVFVEVEPDITVISDQIFQVISAITTTGYDSSKNYIPPIVLLSLAVIGGCSGSTSGGIKIFRVQVLYAMVKHHISKVTRPLDVSAPKYQNQRVSSELATSVITMIALIATVFVVSVFIICVTSNFKLGEGSYSVVSCLFNLGYDSQFSALPALPKLVLICDMIIGRLEAIPIFVILSRGFWRRSLP